ncbi:hypothetical protein CBM2586_A10883 [Cupriavidus phytorum]|uniref:Uncharacterized protein n=1 Tax=Cupriavidus taiwanensis TaxID=164546 RepID=A0A375BBN6_9BURK|nr:hypothetical protein CBM2586_A10883 [Cupriavidus taiwanensis]
MLLKFCAIALPGGCGASGTCRRDGCHGFGPRFCAQAHDFPQSSGTVLWRACGKMPESFHKPLIPKGLQSPA